MDTTVIKFLKYPYKEIVLANQVLAGNEPNEDLHVGTITQFGGFDWGKTFEGYNFYAAINGKEEPHISNAIKIRYPEIFHMMKIPSDNILSSNKVNIIVPEIWEKTNDLRWIKSKIAASSSFQGRAYESILTLQQRYVSNLGNEEWRYLEIVEL